MAIKIAKKEKAVAYNDTSNCNFLIQYKISDMLLYSPENFDFSVCSANCLQLAKQGLQAAEHPIKLQSYYYFKLPEFFLR